MYRKCVRFDHSCENLILMSNTIQNFVRVWFADRVGDVVSLGTKGKLFYAHTISNLDVICNLSFDARQIRCSPLVQKMSS